MKNLKTKNGGELSASQTELIRNKYYILIQDVIEANLKFPVDLKDCILDRSMIEKIMVENDYQFLIYEFGKILSDFPETFQSACKAMHDEFQKDFPYAGIVDASKRNSIYMTNYRSPLHFIYYMEEYDEPREIIRELINKFIDEYQLTKIFQPYVVVAENVSFETKFQLQLSIYIREINNHPCVMLSKPFSEPVSEENLKNIELYYVDLSILHEWGNEIDFHWIGYTKEAIMEFIPDFYESIESGECYDLVTRPNRHGSLIFSDEIELPILKNSYKKLPCPQEEIDHVYKRNLLMSKFDFSSNKSESIEDISNTIFDDNYDDDDRPF